MRNDDAGKTQGDELYREDEKISDENSTDVSQNGEIKDGDVVWNFRMLSYMTWLKVKCYRVNYKPPLAHQSTEFRARQPGN